LKTNLHIASVFVAMLTCATARAGEVVIAADVLGPEGPLYVGGNLYHVGWISSTLSKWDGNNTTVLNDLPGCGDNGLALTQRNTFLLACTQRGAIVEVDLQGKLIHRWDGDDTGAPFDGGINDVAVAPDRGA
jgi:sugar lactone lactonase YvrE